MNQLIQLLERTIPGVDFQNRDDLFTSGIIDSMTVLALAAEIREEFDVELKVTDILPENFNSVEAIYAMIQRLDEE